MADSFFRRTSCATFLAVAVAGTISLNPAFAYIEAPHSLGQVITLSTNILVLRVEKVDKTKNLIIYRKVEDIKGKHPTEIVKHNIGRQGFHPREWQYVMEWAEPGKIAVMFHNVSASETYIGSHYWYQTYAGGEWWNMSHGEPFLLRTFAGRPEKLIAACKDILAGKEVVVTCMVDGNKDDLHMRRARIQKMRASLKLGDYNARRDFAGFGTDEMVRLNGFPGFTHFAPLPRVDPDAQAVSSVDVDGTGKPDICLVGSSRAVVLLNQGEAFSEIPLPPLTGCRAAVWADYNGDGLPDLLLATPTGPKLYTNLGKGNFRDDSHLLPRESCYNLTAAAWIDYDGDGRPDILLGNGFHGLRLYRNKGPIDPASRPPVQPPPIQLSKWRYIGPFDNTNQKGFDRVYPPEKELIATNDPRRPPDFTKKYRGKGEEAVWKVGNFADGSPNSLLNLFKPENNNWSVIYLHREIECTKDTELPVSLGSDDTLTVWLNGQKLVAQNEYRAVAADQAQVTLKLKAGKNQLLLKVCQGEGDWAFYFSPKIEIAPPSPVVNWAFEDVSVQVGFGPDGIGSTVKGDTLAVCDVNGNGRPDILYGAGTGMLILNTPKGFVEAKDSGISYKPGRISPVFGDFDNSGHPGLFVPQNGTCKLFRNDGKGRFTDVTAQAGDLAKPIGQATCAAWGDLFNDGRQHLVIGCLRGPNRVFRNKGDGTFVDATHEFGLHKRIFNTQGICLVDVNNDGMLDMVFANEGQDSALLLGDKRMVAGKRTPVTVTLKSPKGIIGSRVKVFDKEGKALGSQDITGGDGRGGQRAPQARFALQPGTYRVEVRYSTGVSRSREIVVAGAPLRTVIED